MDKEIDKEMVEKSKSVLVVIICMIGIVLMCYGIAIIIQEL